MPIEHAQQVDGSVEPSKIHTVVTLTQHWELLDTVVLKRLLPAKIDMNKLIVEKLKSEQAMEPERGRWEAAQLQVLRDMLSCATSEQQALSHKDAEHQ